MNTQLYVFAIQVQMVVNPLFTKLVRFVKLIYCFLLKYDKKASELIKWYIYQKYILYF